MTLFQVTRSVDNIRYCILLNCRFTSHCHSHFLILLLSCCLFLSPFDRLPSPHSGALKQFVLGDTLSGNLTKFQATYISPSGYGGAIAATSDQQTALGLYANTGEVGYFTLWNFAIAPSVNPYLDFSCSKLSAIYTVNVSPILAGEHQYNSYVVMGNLTEVQAKMTAIYRGSLHPL